MAEPLLGALGEGWTVTEQYAGRDLERWTYQRPFELVAFPEPAHYVVLAEYVTTEDGTGLVHQSPAFGAEDLLVCRGVQPAGGEPGRVRRQVRRRRAAGRWAVLQEGRRGPGQGPRRRAASSSSTSRTSTRTRTAGAATRRSCTTRCRPGTSAPRRSRTRCSRENEKTNWFPDSVKWGRYGDWLRNNIDWAVSRSRYWGTPLPIWRCAEDHQVCVGSLAELGELAGRDLSATDPHRPYVDDITFACPTCGEESHRVAEVIDAWYDSGSMPFAQWGYPWVEGSKEKFEKAYPADFISEAIDQTRGWFYTLMAIGTLVFDESSYQNVVCLGHIMAEDGRKMSKHLGNILEPIPLMNDHGADAVRWFMACSGSPWKARGIGAERAERDRPQGAADVLEHGRLPRAVRAAGRLVAVGRRAAGRRALGAGPLAGQRDAPAGPRRRRGLRDVRHAEARRC